MRTSTACFAAFRKISFIWFWVLLAFTKAMAAPDSKGTDFWIAFPGNISEQSALTLFISGESAATGMVEIPGLRFAVPFTIKPGSIASVALPAAVQLLQSNTIEDKGIHITASEEVTVYGLNREVFTTDAFMALPTDILGTEYINLGYRNVNVVNATQLAIVGTADGTSVRITPTVLTDGHPANIPYEITLNKGQTYLLRNTDKTPSDLSGTLVSSSHPVAVFGGHKCANIPNGAFACDYLVEQLPPVSAWGKHFITVPLATRKKGDTFRVQAAADNTAIFINGERVTTLNKGQYHEQIIDGMAEITATEPVLVAQYSNSSTFDDANADPFMMLIPPFEQFLGKYIVSTPASGFSKNFINVVAPNAAVGIATFDGRPIPVEQFTPIGQTGFSGAQLLVDVGTHNLDGINHPIGVSMYGFDYFDSYGYPGGQSLSPVAMVKNMSLALKTGTAQINQQQDLQATLLDQFGHPLAGVRVDFHITGANPVSGFANTNAQGVATFSYTGTTAGADHVVAATGPAQDTAIVTWTEAANPLAVQSFTLVNAGNDTDLMQLDDNTVIDLADLPTRRLNIRANTNPTTVGSVRLVLKGPFSHTRLEEYYPYSLFFDTKGDYWNGRLTVGHYTLTATPFSGDKATGTAGTPLTIRFQVTNEPDVVSFSLIDATTDQVIGTLASGDQINLASIPFRKINIQANTRPATVGSVAFTLTGPVSKGITENVAPYALFGDGNGNYYNWAAPLGNYTLTARAYASANKGGAAGTPLSIHFSVTDEPAATAKLAADQQSLQMELPAQLRAYPNPSPDGHITIQLPGKVTGQLRYTLTSVIGKQLCTGLISPQNAGNLLAFDFSGQMKSGGLYYLKLEGAGIKTILKIVRQ